MERRKRMQDLKNKEKTGEMPPSLARELRLKTAREMKEKHDAIIIKHNNHPAKALVTIMVEAMGYMIYGISLRNITAGYPSDMASQASLDMKSEKIMWLNDLTLPDPYFILPAMATLTFIKSVLFMKEWRRQNQIPDFNFVLKYLPVPAACFILYMTCQLPSVSQSFTSIINLLISLRQAITLFVLTNLSIGFIQAIAFTSPFMLKLLRIPQLPNQPIKSFSWRTFKKDRGFIKVRM